MQRICHAPTQCILRLCCLPSRTEFSKPGLIALQTRHQYYHLRERLLRLRNPPSWTAPSSWQHLSKAPRSSLNGARRALATRAAMGYELPAGDVFFLDEFAVRQWDDPSYSGSRISHDKADFVNRCLLCGNKALKGVNQHVPRTCSKIPCVRTSCMRSATAGHARRSGCPPRHVSK